MTHRDTHPTGTARQDRDVVRRSVLPGGVRIVTQRVPGSRSAHVGFFIGVGSRHERPDEHGCSHMLEHLLFKGTRRRSAQDISACLEVLGGDLNAWTARDHTCFHAVVLPEHGLLAADVIADMLTESVVSATDVAAETRVVLEEIAMHDDDPVDVCAELSQQSLFGDSPLGRSVIGTTASIQGLDGEVIRDFWRRHYRPDNIVVAASGDVDHDALVAQLAEVGAWQQPSGGNAVAADEPPVTWVEPGEPVTRFWGMQQTTTALAWPGYGLDDPRRHALSLVMVILGGGMSSRLFQRVREELSLAYTIDAGDSCWDGAGAATVEWQSLPGRTTRIVEETRRIIADLLATGVGPDDLAAAQQQVRGQTLLHLDHPGNLMTHWGAATLRHDPRSIDDLVAEIMAVTPEQATTAARQVLSARPRLALAGARTPLVRLGQRVRKWSDSPLG